MSDGEQRNKSPIETEEPGTTGAERERAFRILFVSLIANGAGQTVLYSLLPPLARQLGLSVFETTCIYSVAGIFGIFSATYWGRKSDHMGRKPVLLITLSGYALSMLLFTLSLQAGASGLVPLGFLFPMLLFSRWIYGMLGAGTVPAVQAYVIDHTSREERIRRVAMINASFNIGTIVGPFAVTLLAFWSLITPFYFIVLLIVSIIFAIWCYLPERTPPKVRERGPKAKLRWHDRRLLPFVATAVCLSLVAPIPLQTLGFFLMDVLGYEKNTTMYVAIGQGVLSVSALAAQLVIVQRTRMTARQLILSGITLSFLSCVIVLLNFGFLFLMFALMLAGLGIGLSRPVVASAASLMLEPHEQGAVAGIMTACITVGFVMAPGIGYLYQHSPFLPYGLGAALLLPVLIFVYFSPTMRKASAMARGGEAAEKAEKPPTA